VTQFRIGIDGYNLAMPNGTGVATYGVSLARTLSAGGHRVEGVFGLDVGADESLRQVNFYDLLAREQPKSKTRKQVRRETMRLMRDALRPRLTLEAREVPISDRVDKGAFANRIPHFDRLTSAAHLFDIAHMHFNYYKRFVTVRMADPPEIMHWTYPVPVRVAGARNIYTLHDLVPLKLPHTTLDVKASYAGILRECAASAARICTVSEASRRDIVEQFGIDPARVTNTYQSSPMPASALALDAAEDAAMVEGVFGLPRQGYFLFFGAIEPKKNLGRLLEAYLALRTATPLVIVGARAWQSDAELRLLPTGEANTNTYRPGSGNRIVRLEYLPRTLLLRLIRAARAVLFPSLYEGFGLPVLEAMQLGTPVLTSRTSSLPEVAGDAAVFVDPYDVASISEGLRALDQDEALRARLTLAGPRQADLFSTERYLARLEAMYAETLAQDPAR
jgi:glycosyltransferase involved in cell wall biosynthesis